MSTVEMFHAINTQYRSTAPSEVLLPIQKIQEIEKQYFIKTFSKQYCNRNCARYDNYIEEIHRPTDLRQQYLCLSESLERIFAAATYCLFFS